ncbi:hypothetical protein DL764_009701 [Monosporascus ibericus]|uniref:Uncharacterized protein n=1 Tax=Monosporascus ibericus TaxID=155417 RepID=A0A4V1X8W8_9PEZI|nr:hypothetical protein DL764_009701 [Monosporascus ibericus]
MTVPIARCQGFTNPVVVLIRTSLETSIQQSGRTTSRAPLQWTRRSLMTSSSLRAKPSSKAKATASAPKPSQPKPTQPSSPGATLARNLQAPQISYAQNLASKSTPTILYEAAPQRAFLISSYAAGLFGVMAGGINMWFNVYNVPEGTSFWVSYVFGAVGFMMAALGTRFAMMPASIVRSITLLPASTAATTAQSAKAGAGAAAKVASAARPVLLEVKARRTSPFPFVPLKRMQVEPQQVVMKTRLFTPSKTEPSPYEKIAMKREEERRRKEAQQYEKDHLMTAPFRHGAWAAGTIFAGIRQGLTGEGFVPIEVNGAQYKLDVTGAYALEDGRALDRIVKIEEDPGVVRLASQSR